MVLHFCFWPQWTHPVPLLLYPPTMWAEELIIMHLWTTLFPIVSNILTILLWGSRAYLSSIQLHNFTLWLTVGRKKTKSQAHNILCILINLALGTLVPPWSSQPDNSAVYKYCTPHQINHHSSYTAHSSPSSFFSLPITWMSMFVSGSSIINPLLVPTASLWVCTCQHTLHSPTHHWHLTLLAPYHIPHSSLVQGSVSCNVHSDNSR